MTYALYAIILVSSPFVVFFLGDGLVRLAGAFGDARWARAASLRPQPASPFSQSDIAIAERVS